MHMGTRKPAINNLPLDLLESKLTSSRKATAAGKSAKQEPITAVKATGSASKSKTQAEIDAHITLLKEREQKALMQVSKRFDERVLQEQFPFWDDESRGVPNPFIRSGLFGVKQGPKREFLTSVRITSLSNYEVEYRGEELQQDDLSVWMSLINMARQQPLSDMVRFTGYQLIMDLGWRMHSESYQRAKSSIERLKVTGITIHSKDKTSGYSGSLIREYAWDHMDDKGDAKWMVRFEPRISVLFMEDTTTLLEWETRKNIGTRATLALWLHAFYTSHREPIPYPVAKIHELCKSESSLSTFRRNLKLALEKLREVNFLSDYAIINDVLSVTKSRLPKLAAKGGKLIK